MEYQLSICMKFKVQITFISVGLKRFGYMHFNANNKYKPKHHVCQQSDLLFKVQIDKKNERTEKGTISGVKV